MFFVEDSGQEAIIPNNPKYQNNKFDKFEDAVSYAKLWLGRLSNCIPSDWNGRPVTYNEHGAYIVIFEGFMFFSNPI